MAGKQDQHSKQPRVAFLTDTEGFAIREMGPPAQLRRKAAVETYAYTTQALQFVLSHPPAVVVVEFNSLELKHLNFTRVLTKRVPGMPVLALGAEARTRAVFSFLMAGGTGYLVKPLTTQRLWRALSVALRAKPVLCAEAQQMIVECMHRTALHSTGAAFTLRELDVVSSLLNHRPAKDIAADLKIAPATVNAHLAHVFKKLNVHTRAAAVRWFLDL